MDNDLIKWREDGKHLPKFLRDFHDQKDFFKYLHETLTVDENELTKDIKVNQGHAYLIDCVLWKLARHGYTLQKSKAKQNFENINEAIKKQNTIRNSSFSKALLGEIKDSENKR